MTSVSRRMVTGFFGGRSNLPISALDQSRTSGISVRSMSSSFFAAMTAICFFCFLFSFIINCPFTSSCCASRDQANHVLSAYREHHEEDGSGSNVRQHNKSVFLIVVQLVRYGQREWVVESERGGMEINAVLGQILPALSPVPL